MRNGRWKWGVALTLSSAIHAGAAALMLPEQPQVQEAGGAGIALAVAGNAFADLSAAGTPAETLEPVGEAPSEVAPAQAQAVETATPMEAEVPQVLTAEPDLPADMPLAPAPVETARPTRHSTQEPLAVEAADMPLAPVETQPPLEAQTAMPARSEAQAPAPPATARIEPAAPSQTVAALADVPHPTPRPHYEPPKREGKADQPQPRRTARAAAGSGGRDQEDARRGNAARGNAAQSDGGGKTASASAAGNAAVSNYPGKIVSRLRRALRYPREAKREGLRGEVRVSFTVVGNGAVSNIRVTKSSGSPILDQAAVETVRRAAPFPAIPPAAGRTSWPFTVPLAFTR